MSTAELVAWQMGVRLTADQVAALERLGDQRFVYWVRRGLVEASQWPG